MKVTWAPQFVAELTFLPTSDGGRKGPTPADWFGCPLQFESARYDVRFDLSHSGPIKPGDTVQVPGRFLVPDLILSKLKVGSVFQLWELQVIAHGRVIELAKDA